MGRFDKGVAWYTAANLDMNVYFPEDEVKCRWCPFLVHYESVGRDKCSITSEILYSRETVGLNCPITIINQINTEDVKQ